MSDQGYYNGNALDGDYIYVYFTWSQSGTTTTVSYTVGWAFRNPSPTDREIKNGYFDAHGTNYWRDTDQIHPNRGQYYEHEENWASGSFNVAHDSAGNASFGFHAEAHPYYGNNFNTKSEVGGTIYLPRIAVAPSQPPAPVITGVTATTLDYNFFNAPDNGGSGEQTFNHQSATDAAFTQNVRSWDDASSPGQATSLTPGIVHYIRYRSVNGVGASAWSPTASKLTLPPAPTGLILKDSTPNGMVADWDPPTSATSYDVQYGLNADFSGATTTTADTSVKTLSGLDPAKRYYVRVRAKNSSGTGAWSSSANRPTTPVAPTSLALSNPSTSGLTANWSKGSNGNEITNYDLQYDDNSSFSSPVNVNSPDTTEALTGLTPGTKYYVRVRAENGAGTGAWSSTASATTLPAVAPGLKVASSPDGTQATLTFSPPGGVTGVTRYDWERRLVGQATSGSGSESDTVETVSGLTPGTTYEWRASAWIDAYQSPWTGWIALTQAKPNTNAGDYFDGDSADTPDITFDWTGTPENSTSTATAIGVKGWGWAASGGGGSPVMYRITGGVNSNHAARVQITADMSGAGLRVGQKNNDPFRTEVTADTTYVGSIYVRPSRSQRLAAEITWMTDAGSTVSVSVGAGTVVAGGTWVRITVGAVAPAGATRAIVRAIDVTGSSWSAWRGGDVLDVDSAMISLNETFPYFDGSTLSDGTYLYEWDEPTLPHESISKRTPIDQTSSSSQLGVNYDPLFIPAWLALTDPDCDPVPSPPRPPTIPGECIEDVGVWRRYYTEIPADYVPDWMDVVPTVVITSGPQAARQLRIRYHANPEGLSTEEIPTTEWIAEQIISFMPARTVLTLDGVVQRVWAEVNGSAAVSADHLLYGTNGQPATWPLLSCGIAYLITVDVPISEEPGNITVDVALTARV